VPTRAGGRPDDQAELVARVASARRELLLGVHRHRLRREDLEDAYSQATLELVARARRGGRFAGPAHVGNALEQRFVSRIRDRRRAISGRSQMQAALEGALPLDRLERAEPADARAELDTIVALRLELRRLLASVGELSRDQRMVLVSQLWQIECREFCERESWSAEKYRKVAQRARKRLRALMSHEAPAVPSGVHASE
jgi:DNA-directed RNA polymerase specialized sigma24 family protein